MANKPGTANFFPDVPVYPDLGTFQPVYGKFDLTTYIQGASDYEIMAFLVGKYNACLEAYDKVTKLSTDTITAAHQLQDWINSWFDNLDAQQELNNKIDSMVADGSFGTLLHQTFDAQINQQTTNAVTAWLVANVTPTGSAVVVDKSLSIVGAAADAKSTGIACNYKSNVINWNSNNATLVDNADANKFFGYTTVIQSNSIINTITLTGAPRAGSLTIYIVDSDLSVLKEIAVTVVSNEQNVFNINYITNSDCYIIIGTQTGSFLYNTTGGTGNFVEYNKSGNSFTAVGSYDGFACGIIINTSTNYTNIQINTIANALFNTSINWNSNNATLATSTDANKFFGYTTVIPSNSVINTITLTGAPRAGSLTIYIVDSDLLVLKEIAVTVASNEQNVFNINYITNSNCYIIIGTRTGSFLYSSTGGTGNFIEYNKSGKSFTVVGSYVGFACGVIINGLFGPLNDNQIIVSKDSKINTINKGVNIAKEKYKATGNPQTVTIMPGTYEEYLVLGSSTGISLTGTDRNNCVIIDNSGEYNRAPIRASGNIYIANLTLIATHNNARNYVTDGNLNVNPSYALHIDDRHPDDNKTYKCTVENCVLISQQNPAVGIGLDKNQIVELINCECVRSQTPDMNNITSFSSNVFAWKPDGGAIFYHAQYPHYTDDNGTQTLRVKNCIIKNNRNNTIAGEAGSALDGNVVLELIGNSGYALNGLAWDKNLANAVISPLSYGNNISSMNYTE